MPDALPAVIVPSFLNAGRSVARTSAAGRVRGSSSASKTNVGPFRCVTSSGTVSSRKCPASMAWSARRTLSAASRIEQAVVQHRIDEGLVAGGDGLRPEGHRLQSRAAHLVDGERRDLDRHAGVDAALAGRVFAEPGLQHVAHDDLADGGRVDAGADVTVRDSRVMMPSTGPGPLAPAERRSRSDSMPTSRPPATTGRWRMPCSSMRRRAKSRAVSGVTVTSRRVMTPPTGITMIAPVSAPVMTHTSRRAARRRPAAGSPPTWRRRPRRPRGPTRHRASRSRRRGRSTARRHAPST